MQPSTQAAKDRLLQEKDKNQSQDQKLDQKQQAFFEIQRKKAIESLNRLLPNLEAEVQAIVRVFSKTPSGSGRGYVALQGDEVSSKDITRVNASIISIEFLAKQVAPSNNEYTGKIAALKEQLLPYCPPAVTPTNGVKKS